METVSNLQDPYWIRARYESQCVGCGEPIKKGDSVFHFPTTRTAFCSKANCGEILSRDFESASADELSTVR